MYDPYPPADYPVDWDWDEHRANINPVTKRRYEGGRDSKNTAGGPVIAASGGYVTRISGSEARLTVNAALRINYRELASFATGFVVEGQRFGIVKNTKHLHMDAEVYRLVTPTKGMWVRVPFETVLPAKPAESSKPTPDPEIEDDDMKPIFTDADNTVLWPNGCFSSYTKGVYDALKEYFTKGVILPNTSGTVAREVWRANDFMIQRNAVALAAEMRKK